MEHKQLQIHPQLLPLVERRATNDPKTHFKNCERLRKSSSVFTYVSRNYTQGYQTTEHFDLSKLECGQFKGYRVHRKTL